MARHPSFCLTFSLSRVSVGSGNVIAGINVTRKGRSIGVVVPASKGEL